MAVDIDNDTLRAVVDCWNADATLPGLFAEAIHAGRLKSVGETARAMPYAQVTCEFDRREIIGSDGDWHDWRKVTLKAWGTKSQASAALAAMLARFNLGLGKTGRPTLTFPSGDRFIRWTPVDGGTLTQDEATAQGNDVWVGTVTGTVWSIRSH